MVSKATVAVIDSGGRGASLVHKYSQSPYVSKIVAIPGNDLMSINSKKPVYTFPKVKTTDKKEILAICRKFKASLVDVAQDDAVEAGISDVLSKEGFNVIGPKRLAGQIEWDKAWARDFMKRHIIPVPMYRVFSSQNEAIKFVKKGKERNLYIKAAGLALGKGVIKATSKNEAIEAIKQMARFGKSGKTIVIEEELIGEELSAFAISSGNTFELIGAAQDHKRLYNRDEGPNTGGVGAVSHPLIFTKDVQKQTIEIFRKTFRGLKEEGRPYMGILYLGAIVQKGKVFVIEFNARWGDPEAEVLVPAIKNDIYKTFLNVSKGKLQNIKLDNKVRVVVTGVLKEGLENKRRQVFGLEKALRENEVVIYGTRVSVERGKYYAGSGRLFHVVGEGKNVVEARQKAYSALSLIYIEENALHYRTDIGYKDVEKLFA